MESAVSEGLSGLQEWSEPVICDRLRDAYCRKIADPVTAWRLARQHSRVWRALIAGEMDQFESLRGELVATLATHGLDLDCLVDADARTMGELLDIVIARFRRSQRVAKGYHLALIELAGRLTVAGLRPNLARAA
jgi:hypothetical protein